MLFCRVMVLSPAVVKVIVNVAVPVGMKSGTVRKLSADWLPDRLDNPSVVWAAPSGPGSVSFVATVPDRTIGVVIPVGVTDRTYDSETFWLAIRFRLVPVTATLNV